MNSDKSKKTLSELNNVEQWPIEKLVPYAKNSRTHSDEQVAQIAASIKEWGGTTTVLVDEAGGIISGHARLMELDPKFVDVIVKRWQQFTGKQAIHADTGKPFAEVTHGNEEDKN